MRIIALSVLLGVTAYAANAESPLNPDRTDKAAKPVDPIVTGEPSLGLDLQEWEQKRLKYLECPSCFTTQPFPNVE